MTNVIRVENGIFIRRSSTPSGDSETSPRKCDICGKIKYTVPIAPPNSPDLPLLVRSCESCNMRRSK
jgi:hypothetical protein